VGVVSAVVRRKELVGLSEGDGDLDHLALRGLEVPLHLAELRPKLLDFVAGRRQLFEKSLWCLQLGVHQLPQKERRKL